MKKGVEFALTFGVLLFASSTFAFVAPFSHSLFSKPGVSAKLSESRHFFLKKYQPSLLNGFSLSQGRERSARSTVLKASLAPVEPESSTTVEQGGKSALILSWFYAQPKEIELVKRIYKKKGFSEVIVIESLVKDSATPRGWYKSFLK